MSSKSFVQQQNPHHNNCDLLPTPPLHLINLDNTSNEHIQQKLVDLLSNQNHQYVIQKLILFLINQNERIQNLENIAKINLNS